MHDYASFANLIAWMRGARNAGDSVEEIAAAAGRTVTETERIVAKVP